MMKSKFGASGKSLRREIRLSGLCLKKKQKNKTKTDCFKSALNQNGGKPDSDNMSTLATM